MLRAPRTSLALRMALVMGGIATLTAAFLATLSFLVSRSLIEDKEKAALAFQADVLSRRIDFEAHALERMVTAMARNAFINNALVDSLGRDQYLVPYLRDQEFPGSWSGELWLVDFEGKPITGNVKKASFDHGNSPALRKALSDGKPATEPVHEHALLIVAPVVFPPTRSIEGAVVAVVDYREALGKSATLAAQGSCLVLRFGTRQVPIPAQCRIPSAAPAISRVLDLPETFKALDAEIRVYGAPEDASAAAHGLTLGYVLVVGAVVALVLFLSRRMSGRITRPLARLTHTADKIVSEQRLDLRVPVAGEDEIARLASSFNQMLESLQTARNSLVQDISKRERTEEALRQSEEHLRVTLRSIGDAVIATDAEGRVTLMNGVAEALTGWPENEARGRHLNEVFRIIDEETREAVPSPFARVVAQGQIVGMANHTLLVNRDGGELPIADSGAPIRLGADQPTLGVVLVFRDRTEERRFIRALAESEGRFRAMFEQAAVGVAQVETASGSFVRVNRRYAEILGYDVDELMALTSQAVIHADDIEEHARNVQQLMAGAVREFRMETRCVRKDGGIVWVDLSVSPTWAEAETPTWHIAVAEDIGARKQAEAEIRRLNDGLEQRVQERTAELAAMVRELESYSYSVSHDLRAPLRAINGYSHLLLETEQERMSEESRALLARVISNTNKMETLIDDILLYVRAGRQPIDPGEVELDAVVRSVAAELEDAYPRARVAVGALPRVHGDPTMLRQIFSNLIGNALKFSSGRGRPEVEVGCRAEDGETVFFVKDNGVGFDMDYASKLFGMFQRLHGDPKYPGTGIGLALVKRLVERQGGIIWAQSRPDHGATFCFTLGRENSYRADAAGDDSP